MVKQDLVTSERKVNTQQDTGLVGARTSAVAPAAVPGRTGVVVLGMHRTGTSAITKILVDMGYQLPGEAVPASWDNPKGYWEPLEIVMVHDDFLQAIGRSWSDPRPLPEEVFLGSAASRARDRLAEVVERLLDTGERWVVKDPRMCRLLPLWDCLLDSDRPPHFLHVLRSPLSVAASLEARDGFSTRKSVLLWLRHSLEAEAATRSSSRTWLQFERLAGASPAYIIERFRSVTGSRHLSVESLQDAIQSNLDHTLVHHQHDLQESLGQLVDLPWISMAYRAFTQLGGDKEAAGLATLDQLRIEIANADSLLHGDTEEWSAEHHNERYFRLQREIEQFHRSVEAQRREIEAQRAELDAMREAFTNERTQLETLHQQIGTQQQAMSEWWNELSQQQEQQTDLVLQELRTRRREVEHQLTALNESIAAAGGDEQLADLHHQLGKLEHLTGLVHEQLTQHQETTAGDQQLMMGEILALLRAQGRQLSTLHQAAADAEGQRQHLLSSATAIETTITERLEHRHLMLLHKSLETIARIEEHWLSAREQLAEATGERDELSRQLDQVTEERQRETREWEQAQQELTALAQDRDSALSSQQLLGQELDQVLQERDAAVSELNQLLQRRSWRITAPMRWLYSALRRNRQSTTSR